MSHVTYLHLVFSFPSLIFYPVRICMVTCTVSYKIKFSFKLFIPNNGRLTDSDPIPVISN